MNVVWLIVIAVAVVLVVAAVVVMSGRSGREPMTPGEVAAPKKDAPQAVRTPGPPTPKEKAEAEPPRHEEPPRAQAPAVEAEPEPTAPTAAAQAPSAPARPSPPPQLSAEEMRSRVDSQIADSQRMLDELKRAMAGEAEGEEAGGLAGTVEIMEDGLSEVRSLAKRKDWSQAKEKGEALHAQLALMLQSARRERSS